jgi:tetratricopeptide (TPR) repeat protein
MAYFEEVSDIPYFLDSAAVHLERAKSDRAVEALAPKLVRLRFLQEDFSAIVRLVRDVGPEVFEDAWSHYRIGEAYSAVGDEAEAAEYFLKAVEHNPEHLRFRNRLGMAYTSSGRFDEAIRMFDIVLNSNPKYEDAYNNRGFARAMHGDPSGAEDDFLMAVSLNPDAYQALANLSSLYVNTGEGEKARAYVERLLEYDPENEGYQRLKDLVDNSR